MYSPNKRSGTATPASSPEAVDPFTIEGVNDTDVVAFMKDIEEKQTIAKKKRKHLIKGNEESGEEDRKSVCKEERRKEEVRDVKKEKNSAVATYMDTITTANNNILTAVSDTKLAKHYCRVHVITHLPGGYLGHFFDQKYITFLNSHLFKFLSIWEKNVYVAKEKVRRSFRYWPETSFDHIEDFFSGNGSYFVIKNLILSYEGNVALQALDKLTFYHALRVQDIHLGEFFYAMAHSRTFELVFMPKREDKSFELMTSMNVRGEELAWSLK